MNKYANKEIFETLTEREKEIFIEGFRLGKHIAVNSIQQGLEVVKKVDWNFEGLKMNENKDNFGDVER